MQVVDSIEVTSVEESRLPEVDFDNLGFGRTFSDHMLTVDYKDGSWGRPEIIPFQELSFSPALATLHYAQAVFEGLKAYYAGEGTVNLFRLEDHYRRMANSCERMCIPPIDEATFTAGIKELIRIDHGWVPKEKGKALYIRPLIFATDEILSVRVSDTYKFLVLTSPVGAYYSEGFNPVSLLTAKHYSRAVEGGPGEAKTAGNYAASLLPAKKAKELGFTQVLWLDAKEHKYVEEVGTMNIFFKIDGKIITPKLTGSILPGITRRSAIAMAKAWNMEVEERRVAIDEVFEAHRNGTLEEVFGTGTAAVVSPVGKIQHDDEQIVINDGKTGPFVRKLYDTITGMQYGDVADTHNWVTSVEL